MGLLDAIWTGIDDAVCGWAELFTHSRQEKVEAAHRRFSFLIEDIKSLEAVLKTVCDTHQDAIGALAAQASNLNPHLGYDPSASQSNAEHVIHTVSSVSSGAGQLAATVWLGSTALRVASVAMIAGKVFVVTAVITTVLQTVLQGMEVAHLREQARILDEETAKLKQLLSDLAIEVEAVIQDLQSTYDPLMPLQAGRHVVVDSLDGLNRLELESFYERIRKLLLLAREQDSENRSAFIAMREQVEQDNRFVHANLIVAIKQHTIDQSVAATHLLKAVNALRSGMPLEQLQDIFDLSPDALENVIDFVKANPLQQPRFECGRDGSIKILAA